MLALELGCKVGKLPSLYLGLSGGVRWGGGEVTEEISIMEEAIYI